MRSVLETIILCLVLLAAGRAELWAASEPIPDLVAFEIKLEDDPPGAHAWARDQLQHIDRHGNPALWLRTLWLAIEVFQPKSQPLFSLVPEAIMQAEALGFKEEAFRLRMHALRIDRVIRKTGKDPAYFETLIQEGHRLGVPRLLARVLFDYAFYLQSQGDLTHSLRYQDEAYQLLLKHPMSDFDQALLKNEMAILLIQQGQAERALPMMLEVADYCQKARVRAFAAVALYNLARQYDLKQTEADARRALSWFEVSYQAAQDIGDEESRASSLYGLGSVALTLKQWETSRRHLKAALPLFLQQRDTHRAVEALILLARGSRLQNQGQEALSYLRQALPMMESDDRKLSIQLDEELALSMILVGQYAEASQRLLQTLRDTRKLVAEQQKEEYQRRTVQMGLRVEEERNKVLQRENELQAEKLERAQIYQWYVIVVSVMLVGMAIFVSVAIIQTMRVRRSKARMREILNHIEEGILTFNRHFKIAPEYSAFLQRFTHHTSSIRGQSIIPTLLDESTLHPEEKSMIAEVLHISLGEESLSWELNEAQLPRELIFRRDEERIAALHWVPMFDARGILQRVLLTLRDITEERRLTVKIMQQEKREQNLPVKIRELLEAPLPSVAALLREMSGWHQERLNKNSDEILRRLHTHKGIARSLGLKTLSHVIHELEGDVDNGEIWSMLLDHVSQYQQLMGQVFQTTDHPSLLQKNITAIVAELLPGFLEMMEQGSCAVESCVVDDAILHWPEPLLMDLKNVLVHVLSNAADHGYIRPRKKGQAVAAARLFIKARRRGETLEIVVTDNGAGLNQRLLAQAAQDRNFQPGPGESVYDIVFHEGLSTADQTDINSGRGVGLSAVAAICRSWQGEAHIQPEVETGGTRMTLQFKQSA